MMKRPFRILLLSLAFLVTCQALLSQTIAEARMQPPGNSVTVRGIVTNGPELGKIRFLQDGTAGIAAFPGTGSVPGFDGAVVPGDSIEVTGTLVSFHELLEISPITSYTIISSGNPLPAPKPVSLSQISDDLQGQLLEFECITFEESGGVFTIGGNYDVVDLDGVSEKVYLRSGHPMLGSGIPTGPVRLQAILSTYDNYQLLPRSTDDFVLSSCFYFPQTLLQNNLTTTGFQLQWKTSLPANCTLRLGTTPVLTDEYPVTGYLTDHHYVFSNLLPGTVYWVQIVAQHGNQTILSEPEPFVTVSLSSGQVKTYFNHGIDPAYANGFVVDGETYDAVLNETLARINGAQQTLDIAMYNNNRDFIVQAISAAQARGVRVRYIAALDASNTALDPAPGFPVLYGNSDAIMHNKFMVVDADIPDKAWVMGGSMNWTNQNMVTDFNNTLFIQDQSLARVYEIEFEEMWGGNGPLPDENNSRFSAAKRNNTPHQLIIGGHAVESFFSPSDNTTSKIEKALRSAQSEILFGAFSFTKNELGNALIQMHQANVPVRGIMENINDVGAEYTALLANGIDVRHHNLPGDFHHKYAVVDAYDWNSDPTVVTGSHNWSVAAETLNDENTLVFHDPAIAALFKAEFEKRWGEFPLGLHALTIDPFVVSPNPGSEIIELRGLPEEEGLLVVRNTLGQWVLTGSRGNSTATYLNIAGLTPGQYVISFVSNHAVACVPFQKI